MRGTKRIYALLLTFLLTILLVPAVNGKAATTKTVSAPKSVSVCFSDGTGYDGKVNSNLVGQGYIFLKNLPSNATIRVISTGNRKVTAEVDEPMFPYGGYRNGIKLSVKGKLNNKEKATVKYRVKVGSKTYAFTTTVTFYRNQNPASYITINGKKCSASTKIGTSYLAGSNISAYQMRQKGTASGTKAKVQVKLKSGYRLAKIQVETFAKATDRKTSWKTISNGATVTTGVYGIRVFYYAKLPVNFQSSSYRRSEDADMMDKKAAAEYQQEKKDFARYRCVQYTFQW